MYIIMTQPSRGRSNLDGKNQWTRVLSVNHGYFSWVFEYEKWNMYVALWFIVLHLCKYVLSIETILSEHFLLLLIRVGRVCFFCTHFKHWPESCKKEDLSSQVNFTWSVASPWFWCGMCKKIAFKYTQCVCR